MRRIQHEGDCVDWHSPLQSRDSGIPLLNQHAMIDVVADVTALRLKFQFRSRDSLTHWRLSIRCVRLFRNRRLGRSLFVIASTADIFREREASQRWYWRKSISPTSHLVVERPLHECMNAYGQLEELGSTKSRQPIQPWTRSEWRFVAFRRQASSAVQG
jgi:hypothetical protein